MHGMKWFLGFSLGLAVAVPAQAALIIDMQATSATGATLTNSKLINNATVGAVINFNILALTTGTNLSSTDDGLLLVIGGFKTGVGGPILGNVTSATRSSLFLGSGGSNGLQNNLDGDTDSDWGGLSDLSAGGWYAARATGAPDPAFGGSVVVGTVSLMLTSVADGQTTFNFVKRASASAASWFEDGDGVTFSNQGLSSNFNAGTPVVINAPAAIPEPGTYALGGVLLAGLAGLKLRRKKA